jgi:signal transduction histidine kinase
LPRSLFGRLLLILAGGLVLAYGLSFAMLQYQRAHASRDSMLDALGRDVASSVAILERIPADERPAWLDKLGRRNYRFLLGPVRDGPPLRNPRAEETFDRIGATLGAKYQLTATAGPDRHARRIDIHLQLHDGTPLTIAVLPRPMPMPLAIGLVPAMLIQLAVLIAVVWWAVRVATRPLAQLAAAADRVSPGRAVPPPPLPETGPFEVARAARAFNAMQRRIADFLAERTQILAAISHDLQTPITRMRLRADLLDDPVQRDKMLGDLLAMQALVEEGIAYARDAQGLSEAPRPTNLDALLDSLVYDYVDAGQPVHLRGQLGRDLHVRPQALRRILTNLVDNALKFGKEAEIEVGQDAGKVVITVMDRGPGIDPAEWQAVLRPFYRIESSRNRATGGTGLGLAIAEQLVRAMGGGLEFALREGGGLVVRVSLPVEGGH